MTAILTVRESDENFIGLSLLQSKLTHALAIVGKEPLIIHKKKEERNLVKGICNLIWAIQRSLNLTQKMDDAQAMEAAISILDEFGDLTLDEIVLCFKEAKLGKYGKVYNRIDVQVISEWLQKYRTSDERLTYFENRHKDIDTKQDLFADVTDEEAIKHIKALRENLNRVNTKVISIVPRPKIEFEEITEDQAIGLFETIKEELNIEGLTDYKEFFIKSRFNKALTIVYAELRKRNES